MISKKSLKEKLNQGLFNNFLFVGISMLLLFSGFYSNSFNTIKNESDWQHFRKATEFMVIGKLAISEKEGIFYKGGLTGIISNHPENMTAFDYPYQVYQENLVVDKEQFGTYNSLIGGQAITFSILSKVLPISNTHKLDLFWIITVLGLSAVFTAFLFWVKDRFGLLTASLVLIMLLSSYWLNLFGKNLWWSLWNFYLPLVVLLFFFEKNSNSSSQLKKLFFISFIVVFIKCFYSGYEYITTSVVMAACPIVFYAVRDQWSLRGFVTNGLVFTAGTLSAVLLSFGLLILQISSMTGQVSDGVNHIIMSFKKRTSGNGEEVNSVYKESLEASIPEVLQTYWNGIAFDFTSFFSPFWDSFMTIDFGELILLFGLFSAILLWQKNKPSMDDQQKLNAKALIITTWFSLLAPLSWFILFKGHSYIHTHMNFIVWYMPFGILGFSVISLSISIFLKNIRAQFEQSTTKFKLVYLSIPTLLVIGLLASYSLSGIENDQKVDQLLESKPSQSSENFNLYIVNNELWYINKHPDRTSKDYRFLLHITPINMNDLDEERRVHAFANLDFNDDHTGVELPWWSSKRAYQIIRKELPKYPIKAIRTGQFDDKFEVVWDANINLEQ